MWRKGKKRVNTATMNEATAARAYASPAGERPRVSAASFRDLTARLRKADAAAPVPGPGSPAAVIPDLVPSVAAQIPDLNPPVVDFAPPPPHADPVARPKTLRRSLKADSGDAFQRQAGRFDLPDFVPLEPFQPAIAPPAAELPTPSPSAAELAPEAPLVPEPQLVPEPPAPPAVLAEPASAVAELAQSGAVPEPEIMPGPAPVAEAQPVPEALPPAAPLQPLPEQQAGTVADEGEGETPHPPQGHVPPTPADNAFDAARKEHLTRKEALELEIVWRSLLANPTIEERAEFVREVAAVLAAADNELPAPAPEHDLSRIAPADAETAAEPEPMAVEPAADEPAPIVANFSAGDGQQKDNAEVARSLLDMMAAGSTSGLPHERALAADTLLRLVPKLDIKPLIMMAQRLAKADNPPARLVAKLIRDSRVEVAGPLLEDCPQITDKDLETVVAEGNSAKLRMLARRRHLTVAISDALIKTHDPSVLLTLVRNVDAAISQDGFMALIAAAEEEKELLAPLCTRPDIPAPLAFELFWLSPPQLRRYILSRFLTDSETLTKILKITMSTNDPEEPADADSNSQHMLVEALERAARGKFEIASDELGQALQIAPATAMRILNDQEGEPLMVLLKVAGYPRQALSGLIKRFRDADLPILSSGRDLEELQSIFDTLSFNKARILLTYWDWAQRKTGPYAPLH